MVQPYARLVHDLVPFLHEDHEIAAVCKPAGIDVGRLAGFNAPGLVELLPELYPDSEWGEPVNRLSRFESGVLIFVKDAAARERLRSAWNAGRIHQDVVVVARGRLTKPRVLLPASREENASKPPQPARADRGRGGRVQRSSVRPRRLGGTAAPDSTSTRVETLHRGTHRVVALCRTTQKSTHALKAQLRAAGLHVLGDTRGGERALRDRPERTCLHLQRVEFTHPVTRKAVVLHAPPALGFRETADEQEPLERVLHKALARRMACLLDETTDAFRVLTGDVEGAPGVNVDKYARVLVMHLLDGRNVPNRATRLTLARWLRQTFHADAVYQKIAPKDRSFLAAHEAEQLVTDRPLAGREADPVVIVRENGLKFETAPLEPLAVGLYLDHRENRARIRELAAGRRVLNLFAYTCGFSVAAAAGGAACVVSVDQSKPALARGKRNFELNGLVSAEHVFYPDEVFEFLRRADRRERKFDLIILDPPTFARMRRPKRTFNIADDLPELLRETLPLLAPQGWLFVSTNLRTLSEAKFRSLLRVPGGGRKLKVVESAGLPADFAADPCHHRAAFLRAET